MLSGDCFQLATCLSKNTLRNKFLDKLVVRKKKLSQILAGDNAKKIIANTLWIGFDKVLHLFGGLLVGVLIARHLGPDNFGLLNYALALAGLFMVFATLGLDAIAVREIVKNKDDENAILGTSLALRFFSSIFAYGCILVYVFYFGEDDALSKTVVAVTSLLLIFQSFEVPKFWFEATIQSKYIVAAKTVAFAIVTGVKLILLWLEADLLAFAMVSVAEIALASLGVLAIYSFRRHSIRYWFFNRTTAYHLFKDSWPLIISGFAIMVYMKIDQIMLKEMLGNSEVGIYSAATRISEAWNFIPMAIATSFFPGIIRSKEKEPSEYLRKLQWFYNLMTGIGLTIALPVALFSGSIIGFLFGEDYIMAGKVLAVHIWTSIFYFQWVATGRWVIVENLQKLRLICTSFGCLLNVLVNLLLIPTYGALGAAIATLVTQVFVTLIMPLGFGKLRLSSIMLLKSFVFKT